MTEYRYDIDEEYTGMANHMDNLNIALLEVDRLDAELQLRIRQLAAAHRRIAELEAQHVADTARLVDITTALDLSEALRQDAETALAVMRGQVGWWDA